MEEDRKGVRGEKKALLYLSYLRVISTHCSAIKIRNEKQFAGFFDKG